MGLMKFGKRLMTNLFSKPATEDYPAVPREYGERTRGHVEYDPADCILCNICGRKCPTGAISVDKKERTVTIDRMSCVQCSACVEGCPKSCLSMATSYIPPGTEKRVDVFHVPEPEPKKNEN